MAKCPMFFVRLVQLVFLVFASSGPAVVRSKVVPQLDPVAFVSAFTPRSFARAPTTPRHQGCNMAIPLPINLEKPFLDTLEAEA